jgi:DNA-binding response OmpR family regulator
MISHVLVIESHRLMRDALTSLLEAQGVQRLDVASDPLAAVQMIMDQPPQLILLDANAAWTDIQGMLFSRILREVAPQACIVMLVDDSSLYGEIKSSSHADLIISKEQLVLQLPAVLDGSCQPLQ